MCTWNCLLSPSVISVALKKELKIYSRLGNNYLCIKNLFEIVPYYLASDGFALDPCFFFMQSQFRFENESLNVVSDAHERVYIYICIDL